MLAFILDAYPSQLRMSDVLRELVEDLEDYEARDRIERAARDLIGAGLLFRCEAMVLPTRAALHVDQLQKIGW